MILTPVTVNIEEYPPALRPILSGAKLYDSSCSPEARVLFIDKDSGFFLKSAPRGTLGREAVMTEYFHGKGLSAEVLIHIGDERDWLLTTKISGHDCTTALYMEHPERLCDLLAEQLARLHAEDCRDCPIPDHTKLYLARAARNWRDHTFDKSYMNDFGFTSAEEAWAVVREQGHLLQTDTLLHGDYCLPNILLDGWRFSGFIDLDNAGVGDRHIDLFWALWTLRFNFKTDQYRQRFIDAYGRDRVDQELLRVVAAAEVFG